MKNKKQMEHTDIADGFRALHGTVGVEWELQPCPDLDALASLTIHGHRLAVGVDFKRHIRRSMIGRLREQLTVAGGLRKLPVILCTDYVEANLAAALKDAGIQFLDKAGNAYLNLAGALVYIQGQAKPPGIRKRERTGRAFHGAGLRLVFELLRNPQLAGRPYRELAEIAGISLFAVKHAMDDLNDRKFLAGGDGERRLRRTKGLLDEWCIAYRDRLRPELVRGLYQAADPEWWRKVSLAPLPVCWGGEVAATEMGLMRHPRIHTVYCHGNSNALIAAGRLHRTDEGNVEILDAFWREPDAGIAPDLVVYADLTTSGVERNIETARELYAQRIEKQFA